jgi:cytochrome oxidase Cu insertion factor (SCO1/SenC/PrrC family)
LLHFFHSPCPEECKTEFATINNYLNEIGKNDQWMLLNICLDSVTMGELEALSSKKLYNGSNWFYCKSEEFEVATTMFSEAFDSPRNQIKQATSTVVLLDQTQHVRARFNLKLQPEIKLLQDAIKLLIKEPHIAWKNKK